MRNEPVAFIYVVLGLLHVAFADAVEPGYPVRPIRIVVPQSPGGSTDFTARLVAPRLSERVNQPVVVDNRPGAGTLFGTDLVAKAAPDGYTLLVVASSFAINPSMFKKMPFDPVKDFAPVTTLSSFPYLMAVHPSVQATSVKELIALAKAKPGTLNFSSGGVGTGTQLGVELLKSMAGVDMVHVPYKGGGPAITALLGGQVQLTIASIATLMPFVKAGKARALAVTSAKRTTAIADIPTVAESGVPGFEQITWNGVLAPARTSPAIVRKLNGEVRALLDTAEVRERFAAEGVEPGGIGSAEFAAIIKTDVAKWAKVIPQAGIKPE